MGDKKYDTVVGFLSGLWKPKEPSDKILANGMVEIERFRAQLMPVIERCKELGEKRMRLAVIRSKGKSDFTLMCECLEPKAEEKANEKAEAKPEFEGW